MEFRKRVFIVKDREENQPYSSAPSSSGNADWSATFHSGRVNKILMFSNLLVSLVSQQQQPEGTPSGDHLEAVEVPQLCPLEQRHLLHLRPDGGAGESAEAQFYKILG